MTETEKYIYIIDFRSQRQSTLLRAWDFFIFRIGPRFRVVERIRCVIQRYFRFRVSSFQIELVWMPRSDRDTRGCVSYMQFLLQISLELGMGGGRFFWRPVSGVDSFGASPEFVGRAFAFLRNLEQWQRWNSILFSNNLSQRRWLLSLVDRFRRLAPKGLGDQRWASVSSLSSLFVPLCATTARLSPLPPSTLGTTSFKVFWFLPCSSPTSRGTAFFLLPRCWLGLVGDGALYICCPLISHRDCRASGTSTDTPARPESPCSGVSYVYMCHMSQVSGTTLKFLFILLASSHIFLYFFYI